MRYPLTAALLLVAVGFGVVACEDDPVAPATTGSIVLEFVSPSDSGAAGARAASVPAKGSAAEAMFDGARATAIGPQTKEINLTLSGSNWTGTITDLTPGTYRVIVEGLVAGVVDWYGEASSVSVQAGQTTTASVTFDDFVPALNAVGSPTTSTTVTVTFPSVTFATSYNVQWGTDPSFGSYNTISNVTGASVDVTVPGPGTYYVRVQAVNSHVPGGIWSDPESFLVVSTTFTGTLNVASGGFTDQLVITRDAAIPWDGDEYVLIGGVIPWLVSQNLNSITVLIPDVPLGTQTIEVGNQGPGDVQQTVDFTITSQFTPNGDAATAPDISGASFPLDFYISLSDLESVHFLTVAPAGDFGLRVIIEWQTAADLDIYWTDAGVVQDVGNYDGATLSNPEISTTTVPAGITWRLALFKFDWNDTPSTPTSMVRVHIERVALGLIAAGRNHSCGITNTGAAWCWGDNVYGQLGDASNTFSNVPVAVGGGLTFRSVTAGNSFSCGVTASSDAYCWGYNGSGRLGDGTGSSSNVPVVVAGSHTFRSVSAGSIHACGVATDGTGYCWGGNGNGQLGDGTTTSSNSPVSIGGYLWKEIAAGGGGHSCGITTDGDALCWGYNYYGQLGDGTTTDATSPVFVQGGYAWISIATGSWMSCGVTDGGEVYCWGAGSYLGDGNGSNSATPVLAVNDASNFVSVSMFGPHACAITSDGEIYCWADGYYGQIGDGAENFTYAPANPASAQFFRSVSTGSYHTCAGTDAGDALCWGRNNHGQLGNGLTPMLLPQSTGLYATMVSAGLYHACAVDGSGDAYCWGAGGSGRLGDGLNTSSDSPVLVAAPAAFQEISAGGAHTCALTTGQAAYCWGYNYYGQVGNGGTVQANTPSLVAGGASYTSVQAGRYHSCGVTTTGAAQCWGYNVYGQLGDGTTVDASSPVTALSAGSAAKVYAGGYHSCALNGAGAAYCWGYNSNGQLGDGTFTNSATPVAVLGSHVFQSLRLGTWHTCGVTTGGDLYCWGAGGEGQVGDGTFNSYSTPVLVGTYNAVATGQAHTCALSGTTAYCWGDNVFGQIGNGTKTDNEPWPLAVGGGLTFQQVTAGSGLSCGVSTGGMVYCWGENSDGQAGVGYRSIEATPVGVAGGLVLTAPPATPLIPRRSGKTLPASVRR